MLGWLAIIGWVAATIWIWRSFGVWTGIVFGLVGFVVLNIVGGALDRRSAPPEESFLEFHEAWDSLIGPPNSADASGAKTAQRIAWQSESEVTGESAREWLIRKHGGR